MFGNNPQGTNRREIDRYRLSTCCNRASAQRSSRPSVEEIILRTKDSLSFLSCWRLEVRDSCAATL